MEKSYVMQLKNRQFSEFYLCFCGYAKCEPLHSFGPAVRPNYLLHLILQGKGRYTVGEECWDLKAGQGFLIEPETQTFYQADEKEPWSYIWIAFDGTRAKEYLSEIGLGAGKRIFRCESMAKLRDMLFDILKRNTYSVENDFLRQSFLYAFFAVLSRELTVDSMSRSQTENLYVRKAVEYIQNNYSDGIRVSDIADFIGISRGYLHKLFVGSLAQSPQEYLINYRLTRGRELLENSRLSVETISQSCGYAEPLVFAKQFKKMMGKTPTQFRKESWAVASRSLHDIDDK